MEAASRPAVAAAGQLAEPDIYVTERCVIITNVIGAATLAALLASAAPAQVANGDVPRALFITQMDQEFGKMDADKNGKVTRAEIEGYDRAVALGNARTRAQATFNQLDIDRNGQLSPAEFMKLVTASPAVDGRPMLATLDLNKDGQISLIEHRAGKLSNFDRIDADKDGVVTVAELKAAGVGK